MLTALPSASRADPAQAVRAFMQGYSVEATRPQLAELDALAATAPASTRVYLSAVPRLTADELIATSARLRAAGLEPVPHFAAREVTTAAALASCLKRLRNEADVQCALVVAGDRSQPAGPFSAAIELIEAGLLQEHGVSEVGISGYPDGHPRIADHDLRRVMRAKIAAAEDTALRVHIVTQFGFDARRMIAWLDDLRDQGVDHPVRIGLAGPTRMSTLLKYAHRCGVKASGQNVARFGGLAKHLIGMSTPDALVRELAQACAGGKLGTVIPHFFSFGGVAHTARWAEAARSDAAKRRAATLA